MGQGGRRGTEGLDQEGKSLAIFWANKCLPGSSLCRSVSTRPVHTSSRCHYTTRCAGADSAGMALALLWGRSGQEHVAEVHVEHLLVKDDEAVVELRSLGAVRNGRRFDNRYCSVVSSETA